MSASSSSSTNEITGHHGYPQHKLIPVAKEAMLHNCEDCKDQIFGLHPSYKCTHCKDVKYFHGACLNAKPNSTKAYPFMPNFTLKFSTEKRDKIFCTACCSYVKGIKYTGCHDNKNYNLHPQCIDLPPNLSHNRINSEVELKLCCRMQKGLKCDFCGTDDDEGWCYGFFSNGKYTFACHVRCLKSRLVKDWLNIMIPVELASREAYFESLYQKNMQKFTVMVGGLGLKVAALGLDLMMSAFVGVPAPIATLLSIALGVSFEAAQTKLEVAQKKLRNGN